MLNRRVLIERRPENLQVLSSGSCGRVHGHFAAPDWLPDELGPCDADHLCLWKEFVGFQQEGTDNHDESGTGRLLQSRTHTAS